MDQSENCETLELKEAIGDHLVQCCHYADDETESQRGGDSTRTTRGSHRATLPSLP